MGCGGSKEASPEEQQVICKAMAKEIVVVCLDPALDKAEKIRINAPPDFDRIKKAVADLRQAATDASTPGATAEGGGLLVAVRSSIASISNVAGQGAAAVLNSMADTLETALAKIEGPFSTIATDVVTETKQDIAQVFCSHVAASDIPDAVAKCRGRGSEISEFLLSQSAPKIAETMMSKMDAAIQRHGGIKAWDGAIETLNSMCGKIPQLNLGIKLDIKAYICEQTVIAIGKRVGEEEAAVKHNPVGKAKLCPEIFAKTFEGKDLTHKDYQTVHRSLKSKQT